MSVAFFLPIRTGSQRVINKNTKTFAGIEGGILALKLEQLMQSKKIDAIYLSSNDHEAMNWANIKYGSEKRLRIIERPEHLCLSTTRLDDLIDYVPQIIEQEHILWGHATTPFCTAEKYDEAVKLYMENLRYGYDSLITVSSLQNFLIDPDTKQLINGGEASLKWPRTQDLKELYEVNHAVFLTSKNIYLEKKDRIGFNPYLHVQDKISSFDIDWEEDFLIAEAIYDKLFKV